MHHSVRLRMGVEERSPVVCVTPAWLIRRQALGFGERQWNEWYVKKALELKSQA